VTASLASLITFLFQFQNILSAEEALQSAEQLLTILDREAFAADIAVFPTVLLPFLRSIQDLTRSNLDADIGASLRSTFSNVVEQYVHRFVKQQPSQIENWSRSRMPCSCRDCIDLNIYLVSATQEVGHFPMDNNRRRHVHELLDEHLPDCRHETTRRGHPETLVVTKKGVAKLAHDAWLARCKEAYSELMRFDQELLKHVFGDRYDQIVQMGIVKTDRVHRPVPSTRPPLQSVSNPSAGPAGTKRKADDVEITGSSSAPKKQTVVIDLCDSD